MKIFQRKVAMELTKYNPTQPEAVKISTPT